jgi:hypothetical protein
MESLNSLAHAVITAFLVTACGGGGEGGGQVDNGFQPKLNDTGITWGGNFPN